MHESFSAFASQVFAWPSSATGAQTCCCVWDCFQCSYQQRNRHGLSSAITMNRIHYVYNLHTLRITHQVLIIHFLLGQAMLCHWNPKSCDRSWSTNWPQNMGNSRGSPTQVVEITMVMVDRSLDPAPRFAASHPQWSGSLWLPQIGWPPLWITSWSSVEIDKPIAGEPVAVDLPLEHHSLVNQNHPNIQLSNMGSLSQSSMAHCHHSCCFDGFVQKMVYPKNWSFSC